MYVYEAKLMVLCTVYRTGFLCQYGPWCNHYHQLAPTLAHQHTACKKNLRIRTSTRTRTDLSACHYHHHLVHAHVAPQCGEMEVVGSEQRLQSSEALAELGKHQHLRGERRKRSVSVPARERWKGSRQRWKECVSAS